MQCYDLWYRLPECLHGDSLVVWWPENDIDISNGTQHYCYDARTECLHGDSLVVWWPENDIDISTGARHYCYDARTMTFVVHVPESFLNNNPLRCQNFNFDSYIILVIPPHIMNLSPHFKLTHFQYASCTSHTPTIWIQFDLIPLLHFEYILIM